MRCYRCLRRKDELARGYDLGLSMRLRTSVIALTSTLFAGLTLAQGPPAPDPPNPYQTIDHWGTLPAGRKWGGTSAVDIDRDGRSVWVAERCGGQSCADSSLAPILKLDRSGAVVPAQVLQKHVRR